MTTHESPSHSINLARLFGDLKLTANDLQALDALSIPISIGVPSKSVIKTSTVEAILSVLRPHDEFDVTGYKAESGVAEQPIGLETVYGVLNRKHSATQANHETDDNTPIGWIVIENGLFSNKDPESTKVSDPGFDEEIRFYAEGANLSSVFDPEASYADRAVAAISFPGYPTVVQMSAAAEAVTFPGDAVLETYYMDGSFAANTVGSTLAEAGTVHNKQDPHADLTANRPGGPLSRQDQMARAITRGLVRLAREY